MDNGTISKGRKADPMTPGISEFLSCFLDLLLFKFFWQDVKKKKSTYSNFIISSIKVLFNNLITMFYTYSMLLCLSVFVSVCQANLLDMIPLRARGGKLFENAQKKHLLSHGNILVIMTFKT